MDELAERIENNFINIYNKFDILDKKLNDYHTKFDKINEMIDLIISNEYTKIHKTYFPMKNYDLAQDRFFIYNEVINIPLKKNSYIIFEYIFESEYINIPLVINSKIDDVLEKDFNIHLKKHNEVRHMFKLDYNITKINFYLYLYNNEIYNEYYREYPTKNLELGIPAAGYSRCWVFRTRTNFTNPGREKEPISSNVHLLLLPPYIYKNANKFH